MGNETISFIGGINGSGKTTLLTEASHKLPDCEVVKGSALFMEWLGIEPDNYAKLISMPNDYKDKEMVKMVNWIVNGRTRIKPNILFDAHFLNFNHGVLTEVTGAWISQMNIYFVITAPCDEILTRIENDEKKSGRKRPMFNKAMDRNAKIDTLQLYQKMTVDRAHKLGALYDKKVYEILNKNGDLTSAANTFINNLTRG